MNTAPGIFVTGTDTDVGKTVVCAALLLALAQRGVDVGYLKPVASGGVEKDGRLVSPDLLAVQQLCDLPDPWERMNPICLRQPLCPLVAGRLEGVHLSVSRVRADLRHTLELHRFTVVEGVGGVMVPLTSRLILLDLMVDLELPVLVVARPGLGTINHTLLTIGAVRDRGLKVVGFIFSGPDPTLPPDSAIPHNAELITDFCGVPYLGTLPWQDKDHLGQMDPKELLAQAQAHLDLEPLLALVP
ncbi:MAG: dethiobiotin synthase [Desulfarculus sp.]|nr:dethiobiotin synthase [Desulfarculus sp.]